MKLPPPKFEVFQIDKNRQDGALAGIDTKAKADITLSSVEQINIRDESQRYNIQIRQKTSLIKSVKPAGFKFNTAS
jgi:hypothetical protein